MCYNHQMERLLAALAACVLSAVSLAVGASAQEPRVAIAARTAQLALVSPAGPAGVSAHLAQVYDAAALRASGNFFVAAPKLSEQAPGPRPLLSDTRPAAAWLHQELVVPIPVETHTYRRMFNYLLARPERTDRWDELILKYARRYRIDARFLKSIMAAESEFDPRAVSPAGARGLMQVMPATAAEMLVPAANLHDPESGIRAGSAYIARLFQIAWRIFHLEGVRYTDAPHWVLQRIIAAYHAGPRFLTRRRWFASTRAYVRKVVLYYHSKVTDLRRPMGKAQPLPSFAEAAAPSGTLF